MLVGVTGRHPPLREPRPRTLPASKTSSELSHMHLHTYTFLGHPNYKIGHLILMELFVNHVTFSLIPDAYIEPSFQH